MIYPVPEAGGEDSSAWATAAQQAENPPIGPDTEPSNVTDSAGGSAGETGDAFKDYKPQVNVMPRISFSALVFLYRVKNFNFFKKY